MNKKEAVGIIFGFLIVGNILVWKIVFDLSKPEILEVNFFDIPGEAIFIQTPEKNQILIDGGLSSKILEKLSKEMPFWDREIELLILTHPETDHLGGLLEVLKRYKVKNILWTGIIKKGREYEEWKRLIKEEKAKIEIAKAGKRISCKNCQWELKILFPFLSLEGIEFEDSNDTSVVGKLIFLNTSFLFTGDLYQSGEEKILERDFNLESEILKVAHHGSKTSTSERFLERVLPKLAIICVDKNNQYGHPHQEVIERLRKNGVKILRTDLNGDIKIISDGKKIYEFSNL